MWNLMTIFRAPSLASRKTQLIYDFKDFLILILSLLTTIDIMFYEPLNTDNLDFSFFCRTWLKVSLSFVVVVVVVKWQLLPSVRTIYLQREKLLLLQWRSLQWLSNKTTTQNTFSTWFEFFLELKDFQTFGQDYTNYLKKVSKQFSVSEIKNLERYFSNCDILAFLARTIPFELFLIAF